MLQPTCLIIIQKFYAGLKKIKTKLAKKKVWKKN